jgi:hypothetical protein
LSGLRRGSARLGAESKPELKMLRTEYLLAECILVVIGLVLFLVGFVNIQDSPIDNAITPLGKISGQPAPSNLYSSKATGYFLLLAGGASAVVGLGLILNSRLPNKS